MFMQCYFTCLITNNNDKTEYRLHVFIIQIKTWSPKYHLNLKLFILYCYYFFPFIFISWRLITLQYWSGFCHTLTWISHGFTCVPHPDPPSHSLSTKSLWVFPVHQPRALVSSIQPGWSVSPLIIYMFQYCSL